MGKRHILDYKTIYYIGIFIYVTVVNFQLSYLYLDLYSTGSGIVAILRILRYASYGLYSIYLISLRKMMGNRLLIITVFLALGVVLSGVTQMSITPFLYFLIILASNKTEFRKIIKIFLIVQIFFLCANIFASQLGIYGEDYVKEASRIRYFLGFGWVNRASYCLLFICVEVLFLFPTWFSVSKVLIIGAINGWLYLKTRTMYPMVITYVLLFTGIYVHIKVSRKRKINARNLLYFSVALFTIACILQFLLPLVYDDSNYYWQILNKLVNSRLSYGQKAIKEYGLHLWGNQIEWVGASTLLRGLSKSTTYFYVDSGFLQLALDNGVIFTLSVITIYYFCILKMYRERKVSGLFIFIILSIVFLFEPYVLDFAFNPFVLYPFTLKQPEN